MPGSVVQDALTGSNQLLDGTNITATGSGSAIDTGAVENVQFELVTGTCTGTTTTCDLRVEASNDSTFADSSESILLEYPTLTDASDDVTKRVTTFLDRRYVRADYTVAGTSPVFPITLTIRLPHDHRTVDGNFTA